MACVTYMSWLRHALKTGMLQRRCAGIASRCMEVAEQEWSSALGCDTEIHMYVACVLSARLSSAANVCHSDFWAVCQINMCLVAQWCDRVLSKTQSNKKWLGSWHVCVHWAWYIRRVEPLLHDSSMWNKDVQSLIGFIGNVKNIGGLNSCVKQKLDKLFTQEENVIMITLSGICLFFKMRQAGAQQK